MDLPKELIYLLGRLNFRTSYGQNVLIHSIEMTHIAGMIASELHLNVETTKKGALLHDIGKAIDHEVEGTHVEIGRKLLKKYNMPEAVIHAMESHHDDYPYATPEAYIVTAADAISAAPARRPARYHREIYQTSAGNRKSREHLRGRETIIRRFSRPGGSGLRRAGENRRFRRTGAG